MKKSILPPSKQKRVDKASGKGRVKMLATSDQWHPNFDGDLVKVTLSADVNRQKGEVVRWRVSVWGDDDDGMEIELPEYAEAQEIYDAIQEPVTKAGLKRVGFVRA